VRRVYKCAQPKYHTFPNHRENWPNLRGVGSFLPLSAYNAGHHDGAGIPECVRTRTSAGRRTALIIVGVALVALAPANDSFSQPRRIRMIFSPDEFMRELRGSLQAVSAFSTIAKSWIPSPTSLTIVISRSALARRFLTGEYLPQFSVDFGWGQNAFSNRGMDVTVAAGDFDISIPSTISLSAAFNTPSPRSRLDATRSGILEINNQQH